MSATIKAAMTAGRNLQLRDMAMANARSMPTHRAQFIQIARLHNHSAVIFKRLARMGLS